MAMLHAVAESSSGSRATIGGVPAGKSSSACDGMSTATTVAAPFELERPKAIAAGGVQATHALKGVRNAVVRHERAVIENSGRHNPNTRAGASAADALRSEGRRPR